jgi:hypothetical protein
MNVIGSISLVALLPRRIGILYQALSIMEKLKIMGEYDSRNIL